MDEAEVMEDEQQQTQIKQEPEADDGTITRLQPRQKKEHSIKVPRLYKEASKGLANMVEHGHGLKTALYTRNHPNIKGITALITESIRHSNQLDYVIEKSKILEEEPGLNKYLARILITELLWGKKRLGGQAKPILTVLKYEPIFHKIWEKFERKNRKKLNESENQSSERTHMNVKPRYVRVNTIKTDLDTVIQQFISEGWTQIEKPETFAEIRNMNPEGFFLDSFVPNLLVFPIGTQFQSHPLYLDGSIILQDKASCLPPLALKPRKGRVIMDACAAPGMKTSLLASLIDKDGKIYAIERATKRFETLKRMMELYGVNNADKHCVEAIHQDFTNINPEDTNYREIEYILVDPSCSGSGMTGRIETDLQLFQSQKSAAQQKERLITLSFFQTKLLCHAMKFPNVKRIVYSTCSIHSKENEDVVAAALDYNNNKNRESTQDEGGRRAIFRVKEALPEWPHRLQNPNYEWSSKCIRSSLDEDGTDGFFVAVLERVKNRR